jgi:hypothetical protein
MKPIAILVSALLVAAGAAGCSAFRQQKAQAARADDLHFHNLQVLPQNIEREELIRTMRIFARSLGVRCDNCHVKIADEPKEEYDFPSDAKPAKTTARLMIRMVRAINSDYISKVKDREIDVTCMTCHRGSPVPQVPVITLEPRKE